MKGYKENDIGTASTGRSHWTKEEDKILRENYNKISNTELQKKLSGRTSDAIARRASILGITSAKSPDWTDEETEKLRENYGGMPIKKLQKKYLPNKSENAIRHKAVKLGITSKRPPWTKEEDEVVLKHYGKVSMEKLQEKLPGRTPDAIATRAAALGITLAKTRDWTKEEDEVVLKYYGMMPNKELQEKYLPNRTEHAIRERARFLGVTSKKSSVVANEDKEANPNPANRISTLLSTTHSNIRFSDWLTKNISFPESTIVAYTDVVGAISKEMHQKGTIRKPLENMSPFELDFAISLIISDTDFTTKDIQEKQMCRNALKQYRYFLNTTAEDLGDHAYMEEIENNGQIPETERTAIIQSRIGQGAFRKSLIDKYNGRCIITGIDHPDLLVASHIKPWAASSNKERLDVNNGLLLSATYDRLFDRGLITFDKYGKILLSSLIGCENIKRLRLSQGIRFNLQINKSMEEYLSYHRDVLFVE